MLNSPINQKETDFSIFEIEDFDNPDFCKTYLAHHGAKMILDETGAYTLYWKHGFMQATSKKLEEYYADLWGCIFIRQWKYIRGECLEANELASDYVYKKWQENGSIEIDED